MDLDSTFVNRRQFEAQLRMFPEVTKAEFKKGSLDSSAILREHVQSSQKTPVDSGEMIRSMRNKQWGEIGAIFWVGADHGVPVHTGTRAHFIGSAVYIKGVGWRYIGMHKGTKPQPYVDWALKGGAQDKIDARMIKAQVNAINKLSPI